MTDPIFDNPKFYDLPFTERQKVLEQTYPEFASLPQEEKQKVLSKTEIKFRLGQKSPLDKEVVPEVKNFGLTLLGDLGDTIKGQFEHPVISALKNLTLPGFSGLYDSLSSQLPKISSKNPMYENAAYLASGLIPTLGPIAANAGESIGGGNYGQGAARGLEALSPFAGGLESPIKSAGGALVHGPKTILFKLLGKALENEPSVNPTASTVTPPPQPLPKVDPNVPPQPLSQVPQPLNVSGTAYSGPAFSQVPKITKSASPSSNSGFNQINRGIVQNEYNTKLAAATKARQLANDFKDKWSDNRIWPAKKNIYAMYDDAATKAESIANEAKMRLDSIR